MAKVKNSWFFTLPQIVIDKVADTEDSIFDLKRSWLMTNWRSDLAGQGVYARPSVLVGSDQLAEGSVEIGSKIAG